MRSTERTLGNADLDIEKCALPIPPFTASGDLPLGVHQATLDEVVQRLGVGNARRQALAQRLTKIYEIVKGTGALFRFVVFGSFVTDKLEPNDVDVFFLMEDSFQPSLLTGETLLLFDHLQANAHFGASIFWMTRAGTMGGEQRALEDWQIRRDHGYRGIIEIIPEAS